MNKAAHIDFTIERRALLPALAAANRVVEKRITIPILGNVLIQCEGGFVTVTGTNLDSEVKVTARQSGITDFPMFTVPSALLHSAINKAPDGCEINFEGDDTVLNIKAGRSRLQLPLLPATDFPAMEAGGFSHEFEISASSLSRVLSSVGFAVSSEETRYYLTGIFMHRTDNHLAFAATDGHQFAHMKISAPDGSENMPDVIIPRGVLNLLAHCAKAEGMIKISLSDRKIRVSYQDGVTVTSKLVDGRFPDYQRIIPTTNDKIYIVDREALLTAVGRVSLVVGERSESVKFTFGADDVRLEIDNPATGRMEDAVALSESPAEETVIGLNYKYCINVLGATDAEEIRFALNTPNDPCLASPVMDPESGEPPVFIIMPMRA